jgi:hypothetical protein
VGDGDVKPRLVALLCVFFAYLGFDLSEWYGYRRVLEVQKSVNHLIIASSELAQRYEDLKRQSAELEKDCGKPLPSSAVALQ